MRFCEEQKSLEIRLTIWTLTSLINIIVRQILHKYVYHYFERIQKQKQDLELDIFQSFWLHEQSWKINASEKKWCLYQNVGHKR